MAVLNAASVGLGWWSDELANSVHGKSAKLKLAGLVRSRREGRHQVYLVDDPHIVTIVRQMVDRMTDQTAGTKRRRGVGA